MHWAEDRYWLDGLQRYYDARERGDMTLTLDLAVIEKVAFDSDGPAYRCLNAMGSVLEHEGFDGYRGAPRLIFALLMRLAEQLPQSTPSIRAKQTVPGAISLSPSPDPTIRRALRVLSMVHELHKAGYQRLRVCAGYTLDLQHWRCHVGPAAHFHRDGWTPGDSASLLLYSTALDHEYFGWTDAANDDARRLAAKFLDRHPDLAKRAAGEDWAYAGWFAQILGRAEHGSLPGFFGGRSAHLGESGTPYPPHWPDGEPYVGTGQSLLAHDDLSHADLPPPVQTIKPCGRSACRSTDIAPVGSPAAIRIWLLHKPNGQGFSRRRSSACESPPSCSNGRSNPMMHGHRIKTC